MNSRIFKYPIQVEQRQLLHLPYGSRILSLGAQNDIPVLWALVDVHEGGKPVFASAARILRGVTTGEEFNSTNCIFIGTITLSGWFVYHVFEQLDGGDPDPVSSRNVEDWQTIGKVTQ